jgi:hypothetical protein
VRADRPAERAFIFVGPTLAASARKLPRGVAAKPPVARGNVARIAERAKPGVMIIVDGVFHETLAVGHAEIRDAVRAGWRIWGLSSMGAIRAREMRDIGVRGYGRVFERFCEEDDFQDDEVALLHEPTAPYRALTEPLVHLRAAIDHLVVSRVIDAHAAADVVRALKSRWYGERTIRAAIALLAKHAPADAVTRELASFERFREKTRDLDRFLDEAPWRGEGET